MEIPNYDIQQLTSNFHKCKKIFTAVGDETRQHLLIIMMQSDCFGSRVIDIAKKTNLSRPAVSHHIQILKNAGIVKSRKEGRFIYYYLDPDTSEIDDLILLLTTVKNLIKISPDRSIEKMEGWK